jgi:hypothetical protein
VTDPTGTAPAEPAPEPAPEPGLDLDPRVLAVAIKAVIAHGLPGDPRRRPIPQAQVAREAGVDKIRLNRLLVHYEPMTHRDMGRALRWLRMPAHDLDLPPAIPAPRENATAAA